MPVIVVFREFADERARQDREVACGRNLVVRRQSVGVDETRLRHAQTLRMPVHLIGEILDRPGDPFRQHDGNVVRRFDHQHLEGIVDRDLRAGAESHLDGSLRHRIRRDRKRMIKRKPAFLDRAQRHIGGHELRDRGRIPRVTGVLGVQHLAAIGLDDQQRLGGGAIRAKPGCGA